MLDEAQQGSSQKGKEANKPSGGTERSPCCEQLMGVPDSKDEEAKACKTAVKRFWLDYEPMEKLTLLLMIFTGILAFMAYYQFRAFAISEAAVMTPIGLQIGGQVAAQGQPQPRLTPGTNFDVLIFVKNSGKSVATVDESNITWRLLPDLPAVPQYDARNTMEVGGLYPTDLTVFANGVADGKTAAKWVVSAEDVRDVNSGARKLWVYGFMKYRDPFTISWFGDKTTRYCYLYEPLAGLFVVCGKRAYNFAN